MPRHLNNSLIILASHYPGLQQNEVGLCEIIFCIYQVDFLQSRIDSRAFFVKTLIDKVVFLFKAFYKVRRFFTNVILLLSLLNFLSVVTS